MIQKLSIPPHQVKDYSCITINAQDVFNGFPFLSIDRDSYLVGVEVQSGINFDPAGGRHCIAIGKGCSLAESITFMIDLNHDYASVCQGEVSFLPQSLGHSRVPRKGSIILQNDVWIGHGAIIMAGVTLHNGCVVAAGSVVTKDVPPYAIAGGNPARILRYRFDKDTIDGLQKIMWWDWPPTLLQTRREDFAMPAPAFVEKHLPEAESRLEQLQPPLVKTSGGVILFVPDIGDSFPLYEKVLAQYFEKDRPDQELLIYLPQRISTAENVQIIEEILQKYESRDACVTIQSGSDLDEHMLFQYADYYITTRSRETVYRTCLADLYHVKILYGTDEPLFHM